MPELPEVETVRRQLAGALTGKCFLRVEKMEPSMLLGCTEADVRDRLPRKRVRSVTRVGKFLVMVLDRGAFLTLHLGMTGHLLVTPSMPAALGPHCRFLFALGSGDEASNWLEFRDMRKFGRLHLTQGGPAPRLQSLGPDAWLGDWDTRYLADSLRGRKAPLKAFLLDQRRLAGIGNIYADEILWWCRLSPLRTAGSLSPVEVVLLGEEIRRRLGEGVRLLGCSVSDFVDTEGRTGHFQEWLKVYGKQGQACDRCGRTIVRAVIAGRGAAYCPGCQH